MFREEYGGCPERTVVNAAKRVFTDVSLFLVISFILMQNRDEEEIAITGDAEGFMEYSVLKEPAQESGRRRVHVRDLLCGR